MSDSFISQEEWERYAYREIQYRGDRNKKLELQLKRARKKIRELRKELKLLKEDA